MCEFPLHLYVIARCNTVQYCVVHLNYSDGNHSIILYVHDYMYNLYTYMQFKHVHVIQTCTCNSNMYMYINFNLIC